MELMKEDMESLWLQISELVDKMRPSMTDLSDRIWELAETRFEEFVSAELLAERLEQEGFTVERGIGGLPTAFMASYSQGKDGPVLALLGEYDALPGLSQKDGIAIEQPVERNGNGHGCGHHLLGAGSLAAAVALKKLMERTGLTGTVRYYGCPAEEGGSGKTFLVREGVFQGVNAALTWHPGYGNAVVSHSSSANYQIRYSFKGRSSHAAASPHTGRSALDAVELMNVGANYLREHVPKGAQFHYAITDTGGFSPNVVQASAEVIYLIRAPDVRQVEELYARINDVARGAALMTGTEVDIHFEKACSNLIPNVALEQVMYQCFQGLGVPEFTEEEELLAQEIQGTLNLEGASASSGNVKSQPSALPEALDPYEPDAGWMLGSTDVADVSWVVPTAQLETVCYAGDTPFHSWQMVAQGRTSAAHTGMLHAAKVLAATGASLLLNPAVLDEAKQELRDRGGMEGYVCPIPSNVQPPVKNNPNGMAI
jgi:aminobenzoyl-glutamate utilization protein B